MENDKNINLEDATVSILLTIDDEVHLAVVEKEKLESIELLTKKAAKYVIPTGKSYKEFTDFIGYKKGKD